MASLSKTSLIAALMLGLVACEGSSSSADTTDYEATYGRSIDRDEAVEIAIDEAPDSYADAGEPYGCTEDCGGHEAGYEWAQENGITQPDDCYSHSPSFEQGCRSYGEAIEERADEVVGDDAY